MEKFSNKVTEALGNYVYRLIDPSNGETFYVGKGTGNRVFQHARGEISAIENDDNMHPNLHRIRNIRAKGLKVHYIIHRHQIPEAAMFEVEATLIDAYPGLANQQGGHGSRDRGPMHITEINNKYDLPVFPGAPSHSLVLINVNAIEDQTSPAGILRQVRYAWRIDTNRAAKADFVVAVYRGIAIGIFKAEQWLPATADNFPEFNHDIEGRCGFHGQVADEEIWREYIGDHGKRIEEKSLLHIQNPIRYWNC